MNANQLSRLLLSAFTSICLLSSCDKDDDMNGPGPGVTPGPDVEFYGLTSTNQLIKFNASNPGMSLASMAISNLQPGEDLLAIDFRPATGQLFAVGSESRLYSINTSTGKADTVAANGFAFSLPANGQVGFDFNPTVDRIRLVTSAGTNLRLNPENGMIAATDMSLNPGSPMVASVAYTNSFAGTTSTTLFDIDISTNKLYKQDPPNNGVLVEVGDLGVMVSGESGFDISSDNEVSLAALTVDGMQGLYSINLDNGKATFHGNLATDLIGLAIPTTPVAYAISSENNNLLIFNPEAPAMQQSKTITGLQGGETILGLDMRPKTGQLYLLGSSSRIYTVNISTGAATAMGAVLSTTLDGVSFGFDFNPTVDRIRVVSNTGQNLRLHPVTGVVAAVDGSLNPGTPMVSGAAYDNNFAGATSTTLFDIDHVSDKLFRQIPPNDGTLVEVGSLGINVEAGNGFDIGSTSNKGYALLTVGTVTKLYSINLTTGAATAIADFPVAASGMTLGLGL